MNLLGLELFTFIFYAAILLHVWLRLAKAKPLHSLLPQIFLSAIILHGYVAYLNIDSEQGRNLSLFNTFLMTTWISMCIVYWNLVRHQSHALLLISLPIATISLLEAALFDTTGLIKLNQQGFDILHILLGITAMSILMLAAMQSLLVLYIDNGLRNNPAKLPVWLGPLQSMERYLMQLLTSGFILMSLSLGLAIFFPSETGEQQSLHKVYLTSLSWFVLIGLLIVHYKNGWRGVFAAKWTLVAVFLLLLGYFGSKLVLEFILQQQ